MHRRRLLLRACALASVWPVQALAQAGPVDELWLDSRRNRQLPVRLRWPEGQEACALVLHSHGLGGSREGADAWGQAWQRAGIAVLHLQHPGSDVEVLRAGMMALRAAASAEQLRQRVADMQFALDEVERRVRGQQPGWSRVRLSALGASGHSFGAHTVQALAGQRYRVAADGAADPRFKAFIAFSPSLGQGLTPVEQFGAVTRPFLAATGSHDGDPLGGPKNGNDRARVFDGLPKGQRALLWVAGADHMSFAGNAAQPLHARWGPLHREGDAARDEARHRQLIATVSSQWWRAHLLGDDQAVAALRQPVGLAEGDRWQQD